MARTKRAGRVWSDELYRLFGLSGSTSEPNIASCMAMVHEEDRERVELCIRHSLQTGAAFACDCRTIGPDGEIRWVRLQGRVVETAAGAPIRAAGTVQDVTQRKEAEETIERSREVARLVQRVTAAANEAGTFEAAIGTALDEVCTYTGWPVGHVYLVSEDTAELVPTTISHFDDAAKDHSKAAIVKSVVDLAHALHLEVLAEGVESVEEAQMLVALGCDRAQGFHFAPPSAPSEAA